jgi:hypothetical protein
MEKGKQLCVNTDSIQQIQDILPIYSGSIQRKKEQVHFVLITQQKQQDKHTVPPGPGELTLVDPGHLELITKPNASMNFNCTK